MTRTFRDAHDFAGTGGLAAEPGICGTTMACLQAGQLICVLE
jgi:hypothetical protein